MIILGSLESAYSGLAISVNWTFSLVLWLRSYGRISVENRRFRSNRDRL